MSARTYSFSFMWVSFCVCFLTFCCLWFCFDLLLKEREKTYSWVSKNEGGIRGGEKHNQTYEKVLFQFIKKKNAFFSFPAPPHLPGKLQFYSRMMKLTVTLTHDITNATCVCLQAWNVCPVSPLYHVLDFFVPWLIFHCRTSPSASTLTHWWAAELVLCLASVRHLLSTLMCKYLGAWLRYLWACTYSCHLWVIWASIYI